MAILTTPIDVIIAVVNLPTQKQMDSKPKYNLGDTIPGTIGKVVSKTYSSDKRWVYCIEFAGGYLTISEENIDSSIIDVLQPPEELNNG